MKEYKTSNDLEQAVKSAAIKTGRPTQIVQEEFWRSRLLARIFSGGEPLFVLKGGTSILARIPDARRTRDLDVFARSDSADEVIAEIKELIEQDLGDFCRFDLITTERIKQQTPSRQCFRLKFELQIGVRRVTSIMNLDLVLGCCPTADIETMHPKNLEGFPLTNIEYPLYPLVDHIADKVCAIMEKHRENFESSRTKDLVDLCIIAANEPVSQQSLALALKSESELRNLYPMAGFEIPKGWQSQSGRYQKLAKESKLGEEYSNQANAVCLLQSFINPALKESTDEKTWNPATHTWE